MCCVLRVQGEEFTVDDFLAGCVLPVYEVFRKGEERAHRTESRWSVSGFKSDVSNNSSELAEQVKDAIEFLQRYSSDLKRLASNPAVTDVRLDFGYDHKNMAVQSEYLPPRLLRLAADLGVGIELSLYDT
jgi:hypothetical protein